MYLFVHFNVHFENLKSVKSTKNYKFLIGGRRPFKGTCIQAERTRSNNSREVTMLK